MNNIEKSFEQALNLRLLASLAMVAANKLEKGSYWEGEYVRDYQTLSNALKDAKP